MMLYPSGIKDERLRSWRGRHRNYRVFIREIFNEELKTVDKYSFEVRSSVHGFHYDSGEAGVYYDRVDAAKDAAIATITKNIERFTKKKDSKESPAYLRSLNLHNFRHEQENPVVVGLVHYKPDNLDSRPCFKVKYLSDNKIDYIAYSSFLDGDWEVLK